MLSWKRRMLTLKFDDLAVVAEKRPELNKIDWGGGCPVFIVCETVQEVRSCEGLPLENCAYIIGTVGYLVGYIGNFALSVFASGYITI